MARTSVIVFVRTRQNCSRTSPVCRTAVLPLKHRNSNLRCWTTSNTFQTVTEWRVSPTFTCQNVSVRRDRVHRGRRLGLHRDKDAFGLSSLWLLRHLNIQRAVFTTVDHRLWNVFFSSVSRRDDRKENVCRSPPDGHDGEHSYRLAQ